VNWKGLQYFVHVAKVGNISAAAVDLGIVQPALSRHIGRLESELGVTLLQRLPRGVELTPSGRLFLERASRMLREYELAQEELGRHREDIHGQVSLGVLSTLARTLVPRLVPRLREQRSRISLHITEGATTGLREQLAAGRMHAAVLGDAPAEGVLDVTPVVEESLAVFTPAGTRSSARSWTVRELAETPLVVSAGTRAMVDSQIRARGYSLRVDVEVDSVDAIRGILLTGKGATLLPVSTLRHDVEDGRIAAHPVADAQLRRVLSIARRKDATLPAVHRILDMARQELLDLAAEGAFSILPAPRGGAAG
jgi:LysR family nitrogen assimilation transcriptional regulator